jgi:voltage-gated potassium channel Kch
MLDLLRYRIDNIFARGTRALLLLLAFSLVVLTVALWLVMSLAHVSPGPEATAWDTVWTIFVYTFDPTGVPYSDGTWQYRLIMLVASLGGVFILSLLVGILSNGFAESIDRLRKGKSLVVETGHTLVLGWGEQVFSVLHELIVANANKRSACVVVMADEDKVMMEDAIRARIPDTKSTRIVCRSGSPIDVTDLTIVRPHLAKSIIVLETRDAASVADDALTIKTLLALMHLRKEGGMGPIVATVQEESSVHVATLVAGDAARILPSELMISQIITQTCRQPGLSLVYTELLDFDGDELYEVHEPSLVGMRFADAIQAYETSSVVGLKYADGTTKVNPPMSTIIQPGDNIIALSADDDTVILRSSLPSAPPPPPINTEALSTTPPTPSRPESILVLGWNERGSFILQELDNYVPAGTTIHVVDNVDRSANVHTIGATASNYTISFTKGNTVTRAVLDALNVPSFTSIIILANETFGIQEADAATLLTLLHVRDITHRAQADVNVVTEMLDGRNRALASMDSVNDFIISNTIISLLLTQIAENPNLYEVFRDLFDAAGSELYLRPAADYVQLNTPVTMATVVHAAIQKNEVAIGCKYKRNGQWHVELNAPKSSIVSFEAHDMIVVVAEE